MAKKLLETNWKPTEEELISLGFENNVLRLSRTLSIITYSSYPGRFEIVMNWETSGHCGDERYDDDGEVEHEVHPKSLEELRILISMMEP